MNGDKRACEMKTGRTAMAHNRKSGKPVSPVTNNL